jgi:quercetin dioxygenase-like cupin family protein
MTASPEPSAHALAADEGEAHWYFGGLMIVRAAGEDTGEQLAVHEHLSFGGMVTPLHVQPREDEMFYLLEGSMTFYLDGDVQSVSAGGTAFVPRGTPHAIRVDSEAARYLVLNTPAGHERFFRAVGEPAKERTLPPPPDAPPDAERMAAAARDAGFEILGPPPPELA